MAQNKPSKPSVTLPNNFGGVKNEFSASKISNGYEASTPEIVEGGNLNYMLDGLFRNTKYMRTVLDFVRDTPTGKIFWTNSSGQMDYIQPAVIATNTEFNTGTATDKTPNVKQVVDKINTKSDNNAVVHLSGSETINGVKTFTSSPVVSSSGPYYDLSQTDLTKGTAPASDQVMGVAFKDKNQTIMGTVTNKYFSNKTVQTYLSAYKANSNSDTNTAFLALYYPPSGNPYATCPHPTDTTSTSSEQIVTVGFLNGTSHNLVHKSGDETIAGAKTFTSNVVINKSLAALDLKNTDLAKGTTPTTASPYCAVNFKDKNGNTLGDLLYFYNNSSSSAKETEVSLRAYKANAASDSDVASLTIAYPASGNPLTRAPASDVNNSIVTTVSKSKAANGYFQLGNGLIVQWGYKANSGTHTVTVTLPKAFTTTNYAVTVSRYDNEWAEGVMMQTNNYKTTSFDLTVNTPGAHWIAIGY